MKSGVPLSMWSALPEGVLEKILIQLPSKRQQLARLVCTSWRDILTVQTLRSNTLTNQELQDICCKHPSLTRIDLSRSFKLTASCFYPLSKLAGITYLSLSGTVGDICSLAGLQAITGLRELDVSIMDEKPGRSALEEVCKLTGLTNLDISGVDEKNTLNLHDNRWVTNLVKLTNLQCLSLQGIRVVSDDDDDLMHLEQDEDLLRQILESLPCLTKVDLTASGIGGTALQAFQRHKILQTLVIGGCWILKDLTGLHGLPSLTSLDVYSTDIKVDHPSLKCLPSLRSLMVDSRFSGKANAPSEDMTSLHNLLELILVPTEDVLTERSCDMLLQLTQLKVLEFMNRSAYGTLWYNWHLAPRLFSHAGLTRLSWINLWKPLRSEDHYKAVLQDGWRFEAYSHSWFFERGIRIYGEYQNRLFLDGDEFRRVKIYQS